MKVAALVAVAIILCVALPGSIQAKKKQTFCVGKDGKNYEVGGSYVDNEGEACIRYKCAKKKGKFIMKKEECDCNGGNHGIFCCPNYVGGDMVGGREIKINFSPNTEMGCQNSCKVEHPSSIGVTQDQDGTSSCYCEFGSPIVGGSANIYKTCLFSTATSGILKTIKRTPAATTTTTTTSTTTTITTTKSAHLPVGEWDMIFRQTYPGHLFSSGEWQVGNSSQQTFSNLQELEKYRRADGSFHLFLWYPELGEGNEWIQRSNPVTKTSSGVDGYQAVDISFQTHHWGGLEYGGVSSLLDGSVNHHHWFYAIGSFGVWGGGIPGPNGAVKKVELYVEKTEAAIDGEWSAWSEFTACSATCGDATKTRSRTCSNPSPSNGGKPCPGLNEEIVSCGLSTCGFNMSATCDDVMWLFADGDLLVNNSSDWRVTSEVHIPACTKVIEIHCLDSWIHGGILASSDNGLITDGAWNCSSDNRTTWNPAYLLGKNGRTAPDISSEAIWIWTDMSHWMQTDHRRHTKAICKIELETSECPEPPACPPFGELTPTTISTPTSTPAPTTTTTSTTSKPKPGFNLTATCDNEMKLFVDGNLLATSSNWRDTSRVNIPANTEAIEIHCMDTGTVGGILASSDSGLLTDGAWNCSSDNGTTWNAAYEVGPNSGAVPDISPEAEWIWTGCIGDWTSKYTGQNYQKNIVCKIDLKPVIDGGWSTWSAFSPCSTTCGDAVKTRTRTCSNPAPRNGGEPCLGLEEEVVSCGVDPCGGDSCPYTDKYMDCPKWKNHCESGEWEQCVKENCPKTCTCTGCNKGDHGIPCCPEYITGDMEGGTEVRVSFSPKTEASCRNACKDQHPTSIGVTLTPDESRCYCEFAPIWLNGNDKEYKTCVFPTENSATNLCTGNFSETGRPPAGTECVEREGKLCWQEAGRWGENYCWTDAEGTNWGAECVTCSDTASATTMTITTPTTTDTTATNICTGNFSETGRPPAGTECVERDGKLCWQEAGRWGENYCWTDAKGTNWGAECVTCSDTTSTTSTTNGTATTSTIVVTGGSNSGGRLATSELIGPEGVCSGVIPPLPVALELHASVFFNDQLMVCGGIIKTYEKKCYFLKDAASKSWVEGPALNIPRAWFTLTKVGDEVFAVGGEGSDGDLDTIEKLSGNPGQWEILDKKMTTIRELHCTVYWEKNNSLVIIGGNNLANIAQSFDLKTGEWTDLAQLPVLREHACSVYEDTIVVTGGLVLGSDHNNKKIYVYKGGNWETIGELDGRRRYYTMDVLDGKLLVIGGIGRDGIEQIHINGTVETLDFNLSGIRERHSAAKVPGKKFPCVN